MYIQFIFVLTLAFSVIEGATPPGPPFQKCKAEDSKCIKEVANAMVPIFAAGLPEYNVEVLDPLKAKSVNASVGNLYFVVDDITVTGLKDCQIKKIMRDVEKSKITLQIMCTAKLDGHYVLKGAVLFVPLEGDGKIFVDMKSALFDLDFDMGEKIGEDGMNHWHIKSWSHKFDLKEKSNVVFENLYNGNEVLGQAARDLIANNGNDVIKEIGGPVIKYVILRLVKNINHFFKAVLAKELSLN